MSHHIGNVFVDKNIVGYFEYDGTRDIPLPTIKQTKEEILAVWRQAPPACCTCGQEPTEAVLYTTYGDGFHWPADVCLNCMCIVDTRSPFSTSEPNIPCDGLPETTEGAANATLGI